MFIVTDYNPRSEEPSAIRASMLSGARESGAAIYSRDWLATRRDQEQGCVEIGDRAEAIRLAVTVAGPEDIVLIAGKGHEKYQITAAGRRFFDDCLAAQESALLWDMPTIAAATGGRIIKEASSDTTHYGRVSTDSRTTGEHDVFVALKGDSFDGHDFLDRAVSNGADCLIVSDKDSAKGLGAACIEVEDTLDALGNLARWRRQAVRQLQNPVVVGLTGSCGKTTVKEMVAAIFNRRWPDRIDEPRGRVAEDRG